MFELADRSECVLRFDLFDLMVNRFHGSWDKGWIFITLVSLCLQAETPLSLQTGRNHSFRVFLRAQVARENSRREDGWNGVGVCLLFNMSAHTQFSKHPEACVCAHMCCDGWFCCSESLKAPRFPLGGFSCRRVGSGERLQLHLKAKLKYDAFKL